jgi:hypothetical protein
MFSLAEVPSYYESCKLDTIPDVWCAFPKPLSFADQESKITRSAKAFALGVLRQSVVLSKLSPAQLHSVVEYMTMVQCAAGQIIVQMGTKAKQMVLLQHGECIAAKAQVDDKTSIKVYF